MCGATPCAFSWESSLESRLPMAEPTVPQQKRWHLRYGLPTPLGSVKKLRRVAKAGAAQSVRLGSLAAAWGAHACQGHFLASWKGACSFCDSPLALDSVKWERFYSLKMARRYTAQTKKMEGCLKNHLRYPFITPPPFQIKIFT